MTKIKDIFKSLGRAIKKTLWRFSNFLQRIKNKIKDFTKNLWRKITGYEKREAKKQAKYDEASEILGLSSDVDIRYDIRLELEYEKIDNEIATLRDLLKRNDNVDIDLSNSSEALSYNIDTKTTDIEKRIADLKHLRKLLPPSRTTLNKREVVIKDSKKLGQAFLYLWPALILLVIFSFYPIVNSFRLAFLDGYSEIDGSIRGYTFLGNFTKVLTDSNFIVPSSHTGSSAMINTVLIVILTVPISILISLLIAVLLNSIKPIRNFFQTVFFLPYVTNSLAVGLVFAYMFRTDGGLINQFLGVFGVDGGAWVGAGATYWKAMFVLVVFQIWNGLAFKIMVFMSAIQGIDKQYYQAAMIDATPRFKQFRRITVPLISPTILYIVITSVIGAFKTYSAVIAIFGNTGQPPGANYNLKTIVFYIYDFFNTTGKFSEAAAASLILFGLILILTLVQMQVSKKRVHY